MTPANRQPRVVALVPAWNGSAFIAETLCALAAQTCPNLEILVSDDASSDETAAICERHAARDARFRVIVQPRNLGWTGNVNALLNVAQGDYLLFAFHDDLPEPAYIERCVTALEANPRAILAFSDLTVKRSDGSRRDVSYAAIDGVTDRLRRARLVARQRGAWWVPGNGVFRASAATAIGGLRRHSAGDFSADWPWLLHMSLLGEFIRIPELLCTKTRPARNVTRSWEFGVRSWRAVTRSAMAAAGRAEIPVREKLVLWATLTAFSVRLVVGAFRRALKRQFRRLMCRPSAAASRPQERGTEV